MKKLIACLAFASVAFIPALQAETKPAVKTDTKAADAARTKAKTACASEKACCASEGAKVTYQSPKLSQVFAKR